MPFTKKTWADRSVQYPGRRKLTATGTADVYDVTREEGLVSAEGDSLNAANFNNLESRIASAFASDGVHTLTHSRSAPGRFHALTGLNGAAGVLSCQFKATAAFNAGDTFRVDGVTYAGKLADGETLDSNIFVSGALVSCIIDTAGKTVNFKAGGAGQLKKYAAGSVTLTMASNKKGSGSVTGLGFTPQVILLSNDYITEKHQVFIKEKSHAYRHDLGYTSQYHHEDESPSLFSVSKGGFQVKDLPFDSYYANNWDTGYTLEVSYWCYG